MKALFPGSFNPFTDGHDNIVRRALSLFDEVVVAVGNNSDKCYMLEACERVAAIKARYADEPRVKVLAYDDMTVDCCRRCGAGCIVRGVRNAKDWEYEKTIAAVNNRLAPDIETVLLVANPELEEVSSTLERERVLHGSKD